MTALPDQFGRLIGTFHLFHCRGVRPFLGMTYRLIFGYGKGARKNATRNTVPNVALL